MTKRFVFVLFLLLAISGSAFADAAPAGDAAKSLSVKTFQFKHKDADKAAALVKPLMSAEGAISIQPSNALVITDRAENLKAITARLAEFDTAPQAFKLSVRIVAGSRGEGSAAKTPDGLKDVAANLVVLPFSSYEMLATANVEGKEGDPGTFEVGTGYRADFKFGDYDAATDSVQISDFKLSKLQNDQLTQLLKTSLNLRLGQTVIMGAGKPQGARSFILILSAKR